MTRLLGKCHEQPMALDAKLDQITTDRATRLLRIRAEIAAGTYETPQRVDETVDVLRRRFAGQQKEGT